MRRVADFPEKVIRVLAERAGQQCSLCKRRTSGPHSKSSKALRSGVAAHICAAQKGFARYNPKQTPSARRAARNGIWVCHTCSDIIDKDPVKYTVAVLRKMKAEHETEIEAEHAGKATPLTRASAKATLAAAREQRRLASEQRRALQRQEETAAAEKAAEDAHRAWTEAALAALRSGRGNALVVSVDDEQHARWAIERGILEGMEWPSSGLHVSLPSMFRGNGNGSPWGGAIF